jgi:hypothetical protein
LKKEFESFSVTSEDSKKGLLYEVIRDGEEDDGGVIIQSKVNEHAIVSTFKSVCTNQQDLSSD